MINTFAQATGSPTSGASRAEDFQPLTRNPQTTGGGLQPGTGPQTTSGQDILNDSNAQILVPSSSGQGPPASSAAPAAGGINWIFVIVVAVLIVAALEYLFRRREKTKAPQASAVDTIPQEVVVLPADEEPAPVAEPTEERSEPKPKKKASAKSTPKKKSKGKSKRKKAKK